MATMWILLLLVGVTIAHPKRRDIDPCTEPMDPGSCESYENAWYFDSEIGDCMDFIFGGCGGNGNKFGSLEECQDQCLSEDPCSLPMDMGDYDCDEFENAWYFDSSTGTCMDFIFTGCGGNPNRFYSQEDCEQACNP